MKLLIVSNSGDSLGEVKLSQDLLRRPSILSERIERAIEASIRANAQKPTDDRIVENHHGLLESIDDDSSIMDVPLNLVEACKFDFDKHMDAITNQEDEARVEHKKYSKLNSAQENSKKYDARYKERPNNLIRYK